MNVSLECKTPVIQIFVVSMRDFYTACWHF